MDKIRNHNTQYYMILFSNDFYFYEKLFFKKASFSSEKKVLESSRSFSIDLYLEHSGKKNEV